MKKQYEKAELEVIEIGANDIITDSNVTKQFLIQSGGGADTFYSNDGGLLKHSGYSTKA